MTSDLEARLRAAVQAEAAAGTTADGLDSLTEIRARVGSARRRRHRAALAALVGVVAVGVTAAPQLDDETSVDEAHQVSEEPTTTITIPPPDPTTPIPSVTTPVTGTPTSTTVAPPSVTTTTPAVLPDTLAGGSLPLWPFATHSDAQSWQSAYRSGGHQPWHLDADQTALAFTGFLGFTEVDQVVDRDVRAGEAHVTVGYATPDGRMATAAVIHLRRYGTGGDAPWEVVGTRDDDLTLEIPAYGTTAGAPLTVAGRISGVDENLRVQVRQASSAEPLGGSCCLPAGGADSPWQTTVSFTGATDPAITVVVSTGGHLQGVERFAITGLRR
jgi:hypothetical protein